MKALLRPTPLAIVLAASLLGGCGGHGGSGGGQEATPIILVQPRAVTSTSGEPAVFYVTATGSGLTYQWYKIVNGKNAHVSGANSAVLTLGKVSDASAGLFFVRVRSGSKKIDSATGELTVTDADVAPAIATQPVATSAAVGGVAILGVEATGTDLTYQWLKDGTEIDGATHPTYTLTSAAAGDAGSYTVRVTNTLGTLTSDAATLTVS